MRRALRLVALLLAALVLMPTSGTAQAPRPLDVTIDVLAVTGDPAPGAGGAVYERFVSPPLVDADGRIVFEAMLSGDTSATGQHVIYRADAGGGVEIAMRTTDAPARRRA